MDIALNPAEPKIMHIDLNSAFAMIEQQSNPFLRGRPVGMVNRLTPGGTIIAASYEAKVLGIGVGTKVKDAKLLAPNIAILETDPPKYVHAHRVFERIIKSYSPQAQMRSIDEGIIDFNNIYLPAGRNLLDVAGEIKASLKELLGEWVTCNIGIAPNRFLAKLSAGLHKPDGLDVINAANLRSVYSRLELMDLPGINRRYRARLILAGILTPLDFLAADRHRLRYGVFHSVNAHYWHARLRGWEVDAAPTATRSIGRQYVMHEWSSEATKLEPVLFKMCERLGRRLRSKNYCAYGLNVGCHTESGYWQARRKFKGAFYTTPEIFDRALSLFRQRPADVTVKTLFVTTYGLASATSPQISLFSTHREQAWGLMQIVDSINDRYGELVVAPAALLGTESFVADKIPFNNIRYLSPQK